VVSLDSPSALTYHCYERLTLFSGAFPEIAFILFIAFLLFGPKKLPEIARTLGKGLGELRRASNELKVSLEEEIKNLDRYQEPPGDPSPKYGHNDPEPAPKEPGQ
jgi:TatA/E family protein of Tat protein translocase